MDLIKYLEEEQFKSAGLKKRPKVRPGDIVSIYQEIKEGDKSRTQIFKGTVIQTKGKGLNKTITVRKISFGVGIERIYPIYLPSITKIKILKSSQVRRAKLYYLRNKKGKSARLKEKGVAEDVIKFVEDQEKEEIIKGDMGRKSNQGNKGDTSEKGEKSERGGQSDKGATGVKNEKKNDQETKTKPKSAPDKS